jgi:prepilin-type processing-associated H-X9-DG protein
VIDLSRPSRARRAFTLLEIFVVLGIIVMLLALVIPFITRLKEGGQAGDCVRNMQIIGKAIVAYGGEHEGRLPGPLTVDQYPTETAGNPPRDGQLLKSIARYLEQPATAPGGHRTAETIFTFPAWERASERTADAPVFLINNEVMKPLGQPVWGTDGKPPLKIDQLKEWIRPLAGKDQPADLGRVWALTEADQELAKILKINAPWVPRMPPSTVHYKHRNALYFDWHVDTLGL